MSNCVDTEQLSPFKKLEEPTMNKITRLQQAMPDVYKRQFQFFSHTKLGFFSKNHFSTALKFKSVHFPAF